MRMKDSGLVNGNPIICEKMEVGARCGPIVVDEYAVEPIDRKEIFDHIRGIKDPDLPRSLEELEVITEDSIEVDDARSHVRVTFTPTNAGCKMTNIIGICLRVKLLQSLPSRYKVDIRVAPGSHESEAAVNKQVNDKERIAAALESPYIAYMIDECLAPVSMKG